MKFSIFVFGDNTELARSNQCYYEEVLTLAEWAEELGFAMVNFGGAPMADARRTMEPMSKEVFPEFGKTSGQSYFRWSVKRAIASIRLI